ncbi:TOX high mobility group box family member 4b, partial [Scyliorhinus torazame]|uniref:TOX high mobility group box family member 4b n=1 Tax=Scyliorhinus torazame TaxID=75743 RepID=UPI003B58E015
MEFPSGGDAYLTITDSSHPFLSGAETFHTPSLGDEEFEIPPISLPLESDPSLAASDVSCHFDLTDPSSSQDNGFTTQFSSTPLDLPITLSQGVIEQGGELISSLSMDLGQSVTAQQEPPLTMNISLADGNRGLYTHSQLTTIDHSELSSQLGLTLGSSTILQQANSPDQQKSATPSPASSIQEEEADDLRRIVPEKRSVLEERAAVVERERAVLEASKKAKGPKKKKKKDPNEPQKPVSAYALFFRDTQAAIKGQNPNATFGEVSKIVASMWDSLGEEQKQIYKRKTEAAKKEYLKALASYRASLLSKSAVGSSEMDALQSVQQTLASTSLSPALFVVSSSSTPSPVQQAAPRVLVSCQGPVPGRQVASVSQGLLRVLPGGVLTPHTLRLAAPSPQLVQVQLPAAQLRLQRLQPPPPLQQMVPPPLQAMSPHPPPLQACAQPKLRQALPQPPPLQVQIIQLQQLAPAHLQASPPPHPSPPTLPAIAPCPWPPSSSSLPLALLQHSVTLSEEVAQVESPPQSDVELVTSSPPPPPADPSSQVCVRTGCRN